MPTARRLFRLIPWASLAFLPVALGMGALSIGVTARLIVRFGAYAVVLAGLGTITVALGLAARGPVVAGYFPDLFLPMALLGIGGGLAFPSLFVLAMARTAPSDSGVASGLIKLPSSRPSRLNSPLTGRPAALILSA